VEGEVDGERAVTKLLEIGLTNAICATVLAMVVLAAGLLLRRRPALMHSLWLVVLLMLIAPPLISIPVIVLPAAEESNTTPLLAETPPTVPESADSAAFSAFTACSVTPGRLRRKHRSGLSTSRSAWGCGAVRASGSRPGPYRRCCGPSPGNRG
jgi:hypothetical protein